MLEFVPYPLLAGMVVLAVWLAVLWRRKNNLSYLFFFSLFGLYLLLVIGLTLFPIPIVGQPHHFFSRRAAVWILSRINASLFDYSQFRYLDPRYVFLREILDNIILTMPFGFLISLIARVNARKILFLAPAVGLGIEMSQLVMCLVLGISYRGIDINDAFMNMVGVWLGFALLWTFSHLFLSLTRRFRIERKGLLAYMDAIARQTVAVFR